MAGFLFDEIIFGPVKSRRLGVSLGINLLPLRSKMCSFNCIYCECGWTHEDGSNTAKLYPADKIKRHLESKLKGLSEDKMLTIDSITYAGNGEPTLHPEFPQIIDDTIEVRDKYFPDAKISVLSNATRLKDERTRNALQKADRNILKLDAGDDETMQVINQPKQKIKLDEIVSDLIKFDGNLTIQTLFVRGEKDGKIIDNTTEKQLDLWMGHIQRIKPSLVMIYPIDRGTPIAQLEKIPKNELEKIAERVRSIGIKAEVYF
jgi:wyosine [tRNA(Phe)-imidazoG37] synthetase (radical SAM superfamily)